MKPRNQIRLAIVGPSGSGKSTVADGLIKAFGGLELSCGVYKLARPLYQLQQAFYDVVGIALAPGAQDQVLLETIARRLRAISPTSLVNDLTRRLDNARENVVINDDLRDDETDWPQLKQLGFNIVRVVAPEAVRLSRLQNRADISRVEHSELDLQIARIVPDFLIPNVTDDVARLEAQVRLLASYLADGRHSPGADAS